jgi:hypothetical protein
VSWWFANVLKNLASVIFKAKCLNSNITQYFTVLPRCSGEFHASTSECVDNRVAGQDFVCFVNISARLLVSPFALKMDIVRLSEAMAKQATIEGMKRTLAPNHCEGLNIFICTLTFVMWNIFS